MRPLHRQRGIEAMLVVAVVLDLVYWTLWFAQRDWIASEHSHAYYEFENAFPLAGGWIELGINVLTLALGSLLLRWTWRHRQALRFEDAPSAAE
jgi:hypothetical protein